MSPRSLGPINRDPTPAPKRMERKKRKGEVNEERRTGTERNHQ